VTDFNGLLDYAYLPPSSRENCLKNEEAITVEQLETAAIALNPGIVRYERIYEDMVGSLDCSDAASCFAKTKQLRDAIGFREIVVKNPSTGKFE
jgi:hypothetical protein